MTTFEQWAEENWMYISNPVGALTIWKAAQAASIADTAGAKPKTWLHARPYGHAAPPATKKDEREAFRSWWCSSSHRTKYTIDHPAYLAAEEAWYARAAPPAPSVADTGFAFRCDGRLWVVTDPEVAEKWKAQGFEVTPVVAPSVADAAGASEGQADEEFCKAYAEEWQDTLKEQSDCIKARDAEIAALRERIAALEAREIRADSVGDWLWHELMDYCRERGIPPAQSNRLFEIVTRARGQWDSSSGA